MRSRVTQHRWQQVSGLALALLIAGCGQGAAGWTAPAALHHVERASEARAIVSKRFTAKIPITLPVLQGSGPNAITFANVLDHVAELPQVAWQRVQETIAANPAVNPTVKIYVGAHTTFDIVGGTTRIREVLARTARLWSGFSQSKYISILVYNAEDEPWAEKKWAAVAKARGYTPYDVDFRKGAIRGNCQNTVSPGVFSGSVTSCRGADAGSVFGSKDAVMNIGQGGNGGSEDFMEVFGGVIGHEYTHTAQAGNWIGDPSCKNGPEQICIRTSMANHGFSPCWLHEGQPQAAGLAAAFENFDDYLQYVAGRPYDQGPTTTTDYSQSSLRDYLYKQSHTTCYENGNLYGLGYNVGALATEALIAIAGPQSTMALFALGANGETFPKAFKHVYGISWSKGATILSKVLAAEYATFGPPPW